MTTTDSSADVVFLPDWRAGNPYQLLLAQALGAQGVRVGFHAMPRGLFALNRLPALVRNNKTLHLHWVNDLIAHLVWPQNAVLRRLKRWCLWMDVMLMRARGTRVVWTVHNLVSHESPDPTAEVAARRLLAGCCSHLVVHSASAVRELEAAWGMNLSQRASVVPHGNYDGCYPVADGQSNALRERLDVPADALCILFFGAVRRYKGVLALVRAMSKVQRQDLRLVIAGKPNEASLKAELESSAAADKRIVLALEFIPDEAVASFFSLAHAVVVPFERTLTSGSVVLAMTMGKATLLPNEARVFDLANQNTSLFFESMDDLAAVIEVLDASDLHQRGLGARAVANSLAWSGIASALKQVYAEPC
ncbi:MAG: glycosyltransferase [Rhizobacter sp.]